MHMLVIEQTADLSIHTCEIFFFLASGIFGIWEWRKHVQSRTQNNAVKICDYVRQVKSDQCIISIENGVNIEQCRNRSVMLIGFFLHFGEIWLFSQICVKYYNIDYDYKLITTSKPGNQWTLNLVEENCFRSKDSY